MSNVFTNSNFAVLSIMDVINSHSNDYVGSTVFLQRKPESAYGNITIITYEENSSYSLSRADFNVQARFEANVVPSITSRLSAPADINIVLSNSNISPTSYRANGTEIT